jgi:hypothetical protein
MVNSLTIINHHIMVKFTIIYGEIWVIFIIID